MAVKYGIREQGYDILDPAYNSKSIWIEATGDEGGGGGGGGGGEGGTGLPDGGTAGQILIKKSSVDGDAAWEDAPFVDTTALAPYITSATAASTYATKTELADYATTAYVDNKISGVSVLVSDLEDDVTALTNTVNTKITDPSTKQTVTF